MKRILSLLVVLMSFQFAIGQHISGEAIYITKKKTKYSINSSNERERGKAQRLAKLYDKEMRLVFNNSTSFYNEVVTLNTKDNAAYRAGRLSVGGYASSGIYKNLKDATYVEQREFLGKQFLVKDSIPKIEWEITKETKIVGGYLAVKATAAVSVNVDNFKNPSKDVKGTFIATAWFTPQIPISNGPDMFQGLQGLILELHIVDTTILCTKVILNKDASTTISPSTGGQQVTLKEYNSIVINKMEERKN